MRCLPDHLPALVSALITVATAVACDGRGTSEPLPPPVIAIVSGNDQSGLTGAALSAPLVVRVTRASNEPQLGMIVEFRVMSGTATVSPAAATTGAGGIAQTQVTLGNMAGNIQIMATITGTTTSVSFGASAEPSSLCLTPPAQAIVEGRPDLSLNGICLGAGASGADYTLIAFNSSLSPDVQVSLEVSGRGIALPPPSPGAPPLGEIGLGAPRFAAPVRNTGFERRLRQRSRQVLTPLIPAARARPHRAAMANAISNSVTEGQRITLNVNAGNACAMPDNRTGRVAAVTTKAIVVADTNNPAGGFSDAEYRAFGVTFDTLVNAVNEAAFGQATDIDGNGRVLIFFTRAVNELTPPEAPNGVIGGYFHERDLFPSSACATSNVGEMFYMLAPDPEGTINGNKFSKASVLSSTVGTIAHEQQHLINAGRRMYVNLAFDFEEGWLNEGLSHVAEELLYYRVSTFAPRSNLTGPQVLGDQKQYSIFVDYAADNLARLIVSLRSPQGTSPYAANDNLATRGATWSLLRYLADHRGPSDGDFWWQLVNATTSGLENLRGVIGPTLSMQTRDWATTLFTDDVVAQSSATYQFPSWNLRSIVPRFNSTEGRYPLEAVRLIDNAVTSATLVGGGTAYFAFSVAPKGQASLDWRGVGGAPPSPLVQWTLVRTR